MNWKYKALLQQLFSITPAGETLNHLFQRHVTRKLPISDASLQQSIRYAQRHLDALTRHSRKALGDAVFYEFGAGTTLTLPLALYVCGVNRQVLVDIRPLARADLVNDLAHRLRKQAGSLGLRPLPPSFFAGELELRLSLRNFLGVEYLAPANASRTGLDSGSIDWITSTNTLEHIPKDDIGSILIECRRILADDGMMSFLIDYKDHYSYFDPDLSPFNFLRYSARTWPLFNPRLHYQNRLRHRDYVELAREAGLEIVEESRVDGSEKDVEAIRTMPVATMFRKYEREELLVRSALLVLCKSTDTAEQAAF